MAAMTAKAAVDSASQRNQGARWCSSWAFSWAASAALSTLTSPISASSIGALSHRAGPAAILWPPHARRPRSASGDPRALEGSRAPLLGAGQPALLLVHALPLPRRAPARAGREAGAHASAGRRRHARGRP